MFAKTENDGIGKQKIRYAETVTLDPISVLHLPGICFLYYSFSGFRLHINPLEYFIDEVHAKITITFFLRYTYVTGFSSLMYNFEIHGNYPRANNGFNQEIYKLVPGAK